jgi:hypothetical protein
MEIDWPCEFRWVERDIKRDPKISHYHGPDRETVLQVRYRMDNIGVYFVDRESRYSNWLDVPTVRLP